MDLRGATATKEVFFVGCAWLATHAAAPTTDYETAAEGHPYANYQIMFGIMNEWIMPLDLV